MEFVINLIIVKAWLKMCITDVAGRKQGSLRKDVGTLQSKFNVDNSSIIMILTKKKTLSTWILRR